MIQVVEWHFEVMFCFLTNRNCDCFQVGKATIQVMEWHLKIHFLPLDKPLNSTLVMSRKQCFKMIARHWELIFFLLTSSKCDLCEFQEAIFQKFPLHFELIYVLLTITKCKFVEVEKALFQGAP